MPSVIARRIIRGVSAAAIGALTLIVLVVALLQIPGIATPVARRLLALAPLNPGYALDVARVSGNWLTGLQLERVTLRRGSKVLASIDRVGASYDPLQLRGPDRRLRELLVDGAQVAASRQGGEWDIANAFQSSPDTASTAGGDFIIDRLLVRRVDVAAQLAPDSTARVRDLRLDGRDLIVGEAVLLTMDTLSADLAPPGEPALWFALAAAGAATAEEIRLDPLRIESHRSDIAGHAVIPRSFDDPKLAQRLDVRLEALPLALADLASVYPGVPPDGDLEMKATASAEGRWITARLAARLDQGSIEMEGGTAVGRGVPAVYKVHGEVRDLDPSRLHRSAPMGRLNGEIDADLRGETLSVADGSASVRLRGSTVGETDLRDLHLRADVTRGRADLRLRSQLLGGTVHADGWARPFDSIPSYRIAGGALGLDGTAPAAAALAGKAGDPTLDVRFRIGGEGISPTEADLDGRVDLEAVRSDRSRVSLGGAALNLAGGELEVRPNLLIGGGRVTGLATARFGDTITYRIRGGRFDGVDLGKLMNDTVAAPLTGRFQLAGTGTAPDEASLTARIELDELRYAARRVEQIVAKARLQGGRAVFDLDGEIQGGRITVLATAHPFDSTITFDIRRAALDSVDLGTFMGRPDLAGPVTLGATGGGRWGESNRAVKGKLTLEPSRLGHVQVVTGTVDAELAGERLTYDAAVQTNGGSVTVAGEGRPMAGTPSYVVRSGEATSLDLGALLGRDSLATDLDARFTASVTGAGLDSMLARLDFTLLPSRVNQAELGPGRMTIALDRGALDGNLRLQGQDAEINSKLTGTLGRDTSRFRAEGDLRIERLARWTADTTADGRVEGRFGLDAVTDSTGLLSAGGTVTAVGGVGEVELRQLYLALRPTPGVLALDTLVLRSNVATFDGAGSLSLRPSALSGGTDTLRITGRTGDLTPLAMLAGADTVALDSTLLDLTFTGPADRRRIDGHADVFRLLYGANLVERLTARGSATVDSAGLGAATGNVRIIGAAAGKMAVRQIDLAGRYDSVVSLRGRVTVDDDIRLALDLDGTTSGDTMTARLDRLDLVEGGRTWKLARPATIGLQPGIVKVGGLSLGAGDRSIAIDGRFDRRDSSDMTLRIDNFELDALAESKLVPLGGRLDGSFRLSGRAEEPSVEGKAVLAIRHDGDAGRLTSNIDWTRRGLRLRAEAAPPAGAGLIVEGLLPWRLTLVPEDTAAAVGFARAAADTMALTVRADSFDLGFFEPFLPEGAASDLTGALDVDGRIGGTPDKPHAAGTVDLRGFGVELPALGVTYSEGRLAGKLDAGRFLIDTLRVTTGEDEELFASGRVDLEPISDPKLDISTRLSDFRVSNSDQLQSLASGELALRGTAAKPSLTGKIQLGRTEVFVGGPTAAAVEEVELTPADLQQLARHFGPAATAGADESGSFIDRFHIDLDVSFPRRLWIRKAQSPSVDLELSGRIAVKQQPGQPMQFFGQVEPIPNRGEMNLYGRTFKVVEGRVALQGPVEATTVDVTAQYQVPTQGDPDDEDVLINVQATGNPDSLKLDFTAEPAMPQEDIISYIITGRPSSDNALAGGGEGGGINPEQIAVGQLAGSLGGAAGEQLGFDVFQIRQEPARGLTLTAGRYLSSRVYVSLQQPLRIGASSEQQAAGSTGPGFELEYSLRRWLRTTLRGGSLPTGVMMRGRYAF